MADAWQGSEPLAKSGSQIEQFDLGLEQMPVPIDDEALVITDNADIYGTVADNLRAGP